MLSFMSLLAACTGEPEGLKALEPDIVVNPTVLDFGQVVEDYSSTSSVDIINSGLGKLNIESITLGGDDAAFFTLGDPPLELDKDEVYPLEITFSPKDPIPYTATLTVHSDDPDKPDEGITITGTGRVAPTPNIDCDTLALEYAEVAAGSVGTQWVTCTNIGDDDLAIESVVAEGSGEFSLANDPTGYAVPPGQSIQLIVLYLPTSEVGANGGLTLTTNDPDTPETYITLLGNGGGDYEYPVAVITGPTESDPRESVTLDGGDSYDPNGYEPLTYSWSVVGPYDDVPTETSNEMRNLTVQLDLAGEYRVSLQVTNSLGVRSAPTVHTITVTPEEDLHVELIWDGDADLDLHLIQGGGSIYQGETDCNYCNINPDWGAIGSRADDPTLDIDALRSPPGIENINIDAPADDTYSVKVMYYDDHGAGDVTATVNIYLYGVLEETFSKALGYNEVWDVGRIVWPDGYVIEETTDLYTQEFRICQD